MFGWLKPKPAFSEFDKQLIASNLTGAKDLEELKQKETILSAIRSLELKQNPIKGEFDYAHLKNIHRHIFKDIYIWAGMDRYEIGLRGDFRKGDSFFTNGSRLPAAAKALFDELKKENYFKGLQREQYIKSFASFMNGLNILHPFREGNGRVQRIFLEELADYANWNLNLSRVSVNTMIQASIMAHKGNLKGLEIIIRDNLYLGTII